MITNSDAVLWYNVGVFGEAGYGVPNWSNDVGSVNPQILDLVDIVGQNLFNIMHHEDADMRIPPSINTLMRIHKLYVRCGQILGGRAIPSNMLNMEVKHVNPGGGIFNVYPVPFFKVRNIYMKRWGSMIMIMLAECMQHTENRKEMEISVAFAGQVGQYLKRVYQNMSVEMFGKTLTEVVAEDFLLKDEDFTKFDPAKFFTSTELVDTVPRLDRIFTEDRLELLREGLPVTSLPDLKPWPVNLTDYYNATRVDATISGTDGVNKQTGIIPAAPGP